MGTLMLPLFQFKHPGEIFHVIFTVSLLVSFSTFYLLFRRHLQNIHQSVAAGKNSETLLLSICLLVYASSSSVVMGAYNTGFYEHFLELIVLVSVIAALKDRVLPLLVLGPLAVLVHEICSVYGFPVIALALLVSAVEKRRLGMSLVRVAVVPLAWIAVTGATLLISYLLSPGVDDRQLDSLKADVMKMSGMNENLAEEAVFHLRHRHVDIAKMQVNIAERFYDSNIVRTTYPATAFLLAALFLLLKRQKRLLYFALAAPAALAPLSLHFAAWDTARFSAFTTFQAMAILLVFSREDDRAELFERKEDRAWPSIVLLVVGLAVCWNSLRTDIFWGRFPITEEANGNIRTAPPIQWFQNCPTLFENSDFKTDDLKNWTQTEKVFQYRKAPPAPAHYDGGPEGVGFAQTVASKSHAAENKKALLSSKEFVINRNDIIFMAKSSPTPKKPDSFVALDIDGEEVLRQVIEPSDVFLRYAWDVRKFRGKKAEIRIVAGNPREGAIAVDGFCYD